MHRWVGNDRIVNVAGLLPSVSYNRRANLSWPSHFQSLSVAKIAFGLLLLAHITAAQYRFDSFTTDNGLPQNSVRAIAQTPDGYLWLTTFDGLVRYDGAKFTIFDKSNTPEITSNRFASLHVDDEGTLFAGTEDGGLIVYHAGRFRAFTTSDGLPSNNISGFSFDRRGEFYVRIDGGNAYYRNGQFVPLPEADALNRGGFYSRRTGNTWQIDVNGVRQTERDGRETFYALKTEYYNANFGGIATFEDSAGAFWFGDRRGVYRLQNGDITRGSGAAGVPPGMILRPLTEEDDGGIWLAPSPLPSDVGPGPMLYKDGKFTAWGTSVGLSSNNIVGIFKDREGTIWLSTFDKGLNHLEKQVIKTLSTSDGLANSEVYPILQTRDGDIYIGTSNGLSHYVDGKFTGEVRAPGGNPISATALAEDEYGRVWIGGTAELLALENGSVHTIKLPRGIVYAIYCDGKNVMWVGTGEDLYQLEDEKIVRRFTTADGLPNNDIKYIHMDGQGALWVGTFGGLARITNCGPGSADCRIQTYTTVDGLASDRVRSIHEDERGTLWFGTYDGGMSRYRDGKFFNYTVNNGLFSNGVFRILDDAKGNFWISSNRGIYRVNRQELEDVAAGRLTRVNSVAYGKPDGMLNSECNGGRQPAGIKAQDGNLWFPTMDGVAIVDPNAVAYNTIPPPVHIESVLMERTPIDFQDGITLAANDDNLEIRYTGISFIKPEQVKFRYRIEGLDENWIDVGAVREVYFPSLPAGEYKFHVIAANSDGVWNDQGASLALNVLPPFWHTRWFIALMLLVVGGLAFSGYKVRTTQFKKEKKRQEDFSRRLIDLQENERKRIAGELHDSLSQNLVIIKNRAAISLQERDTEQAFEQLEEIADAAGESLSEVREIAHNLRPFQIDRLGITKAIEALVRKANTPELKVTAEFDHIDGAFAPEMEINLYRIIQESLNNIIKHAGATEASVTIVKTGKVVDVVIRDNGKGFDTSRTRLGESREGGGFGLVGITERARILAGVPVIESAPGQGTTISLKVESES